MKQLHHYETVLLSVEENNRSIKLSYQNHSQAENKQTNLLDLIKLVNYKQLNGFSLNYHNIIILDLSHVMVNLNEVEKLDLPNLKQFIASDSSLCLVPPFIYNGMGRLEYLDLSENNISHFNCSFKSIKKIKVIKLHNNKLENLPYWFLTYECTGMEELNFSLNVIRKCQHEKENYNLQIMNIKKLELRNCSLLDRHLDYLNEFQTLRHLDISNDRKCLIKENKFSDLNAKLCNIKWHNIEILILKNLALSSFPKNCINLITLKKLDLSYNTLWNLPEEISNLSNLEILHIDNCEIYSLPKCLGTLSSLRILIASFNFIEEVKDIPVSLKYFDAYDNRIDTIECDISNINCDFGLNFLNCNDDSGYTRRRDLLWNLFNIKHRSIETKYKEQPSVEEIQSGYDQCHQDEEDRFSCLNISNEYICEKSGEPIENPVNDDEQWEESTSSGHNLFRTFVHPEIIPFQLSEDLLFADVD